MDKVEFEVLSSDGVSTYIVDFQRLGNKVAASCSCPAVLQMTYCKHRTEIIYGDYGRIISGNIEDVEKVHAMLYGSELETTLNLVLAAEKNVERAKKELANANKAVAKAMQG